MWNHDRLAKAFLSEIGVTAPLTLFLRPAFPAWLRLATR